jgi:hypothetical protein
MNNVLVTVLENNSEVRIRRQTSMSQTCCSFRILTQDTRHVLEGGDYYIHIRKIQLICAINGVFP